MSVRCPVALRLLAAVPTLHLAQHQGWATALANAAISLRNATSR